MMKALFACMLLFAFYPAAAAPMWIERQAVPKAALLDPGLAREDASSSVVIDHGAWSKFLRTYVVPGEDGVNRVRYGAVTDADRKALQDYIAALGSVDVAGLARREQLAFWFNLYNAATVKLILDNPGVSSIQNIRRPWGTPVVTVQGRTLTLNDIEHGVIRPIAKDPRIHYAVNCASIGCPNLSAAPFTGADLDAQLDAAASSFVNHPRGVSVVGGKLVVSKIFGWYSGDFGETDAAVIAQLRRYAGPALDEKLAQMRKIAGYRYDWSLNAAP
jgi:hypothetical protein